MKNIGQGLGLASTDFSEIKHMLLKIKGITHVRKASVMFQCICESGPMLAITIIYLLKREIRTRENI